MLALPFIWWEVQQEKEMHVNDTNITIHTDPHIRLGIFNRTSRYNNVVIPQEPFEAFKRERGWRGE